ncbi:hypothetical protein V7x_25760 [Crateriforma conspicua]|uniref:Uncharacterized protein n=1 Tax=Crateriforma conspicua TaxID=2527996 RepID=A0A5C6FXD7_9PLAN|nr:hypothetical protein V7x_25760 [Crateriforma conspicua]
MAERKKPSLTILAGYAKRCDYYAEHNETMLAKPTVQRSVAHLDSGHSLYYQRPFFSDLSTIGPYIFELAYPVSLWLFSGAVQLRDPPDAYCRSEEWS